MRASLPSRLLYCWLAFSVMLSSMGYGLVEHWCQMRGHTKALLAFQKECPKPCQVTDQSTPPASGSVVKRSACCKTNITYEHVDVSSFVADNQSLPAPSPAAFFTQPQLRFLLTMLLPETSDETSRPTADPPYFRAGRFLLSSLCTWLI